mmetsp:Transcript_33494/g.48576  ORF Transcript_33494/g.48576 Transcript_33494/m.48576 type:complete len:277 (-) Transcript_33494:518-1348(-)
MKVSTLPTIFTIEECFLSFAPLSWLDSLSTKSSPPTVSLDTLPSTRCLFCSNSFRILVSDLWQVRHCCNSMNSSMRRFESNIAEIKYASTGISLRGPRMRAAFVSTSSWRRITRWSVLLRPREATSSATFFSSSSSVITSCTCQLATRRSARTPLLLLPISFFLHAVPPTACCCNSRFASRFFLRASLVTTSVPFFNHFARPLSNFSPSPSSLSTSLSDDLYDSSSQSSLATFFTALAFGTTTSSSSSDSSSSSSGSSTASSSSSSTTTSLYFSGC